MKSFLRIAAACLLLALGLNSTLEAAAASPNFFHGKPDDGDRNWGSTYRSMVTSLDNFGNAFICSSENGLL